MANAKDLRRRIRSVKNTAQITRAMQMVSATKMRRAQNQALGGRDYWETLLSVLSQLEADKLPSHPLLEANSSDKVGVLVLTSDKGLCGALNSNLVRTINNIQSALGKQELTFYTRGKKGRDFVVRSGKHLEADFENLEHIHQSQARIIRNLLVSDFKEGKFGQLHVIYPHFVSTLKQEPKIVKLLPIEIASLEDFVRQTLKQTQSVSKPQSTNQTDFIFEPDLSSLLEFGLLHMIDVAIYQSLLETKASEHSARMIAMQNATANASDLVEDLTLTYNGLRQESITRELLEITGASAALE